MWINVWNALCTVIWLMKMMTGDEVSRAFHLLTNLYSQLLHFMVQKIKAASLPAFDRACIPETRTFAAGYSIAARHVGVEHVALYYFEKERVFVRVQDVVKLLCLRLHVSSCPLFPDGVACSSRTVKLISKSTTSSAGLLISLPIKTHLPVMDPLLLSLLTPLRLTPAAPTTPSFAAEAYQSSEQNSGVSGCEWMCGEANLDCMKIADSCLRGALFLQVT